MKAADFLTQREAAERLGCSVRKVQKLAKGGALPVYRPFGTRTPRYSQDDINRLFARPAPIAGHPVAKGLFR